MEPHVPLPAPGWNEHWDPAPMRCPECNNILATVNPASLKSGHLEGVCPTHGRVRALQQSPDLGTE